MSVKILSLVWEHSKASGTPLLVLLSLADYSDDEGECWPSISAIRRKCRLKDDRHVKRVIHETLELELGEVVVIPGGGKASIKGGVRSNRYRIVVHLPEIVVEQPPSGGADSGSATTVSGPDSGSPARRTVVERRTTVVAQPPEPSVEPSVEPSPLPVVAKATPARRRDPLFNAVVDALSIKPNELTSSARGALNKALADLRSVNAGPDDVYDRADVYRRRWPNVSLTPTSLARHWAELNPETSEPTDAIGRAFAVARKAGL